MKVIGIIPARWGSTRFEGKVLASIASKPMIEHVWSRSLKSKVLSEVIIACDDKKVFDTAISFGAKAVMTSKDHNTGTDRIAEAVENLDADIVVNIQADEPLIDCSIIDNLAQALIGDELASISTAIKEIENKEDLVNKNVVKVVIDNSGYALYFSRSLIPFNRVGEQIKDVTYYKHLGIYAYRKDFILKFKSLPQTSLEQTEKLEQLRAIEAGYKIKTVLTDIETIGVDTKEDLEIVEGILNNPR
ncbi:MAG: 3-deoxy-manno-octulosonate cytidylyltransferase [Candidatus Zapsychrus exili]|nr:3-deoxy-manno-octulosonate cytidylyltransferase [Candidatus Zapsychrus exili]